MWLLTSDEGRQPPIYLGAGTVMAMHHQSIAQLLIYSSWCPTCPAEPPACLAPLQSARCSWLLADSEPSWKRSRPHRSSPTPPMYSNTRHTTVIGHKLDKRRCSHVSNICRLNSAIPSFPIYAGCGGCGLRINIMKTGPCAHA